MLRIVKYLCLAWILGLIVFYVMASMNASLNPAEGIVVFTGGPERIQEGVQLFKDKRGAFLLISGVRSHITPEKLVDTAAVPPEKLTLGHVAVNTEENVMETREWAEKLKLSSLIVVTAHYHMPRVMTLLKKELPATTLIEHPVVSKEFRTRYWITDLKTVWKFLREYHKFLVTMVQVHLLQRL